MSVTDLGPARTEPRLHTRAAPSSAAQAVPLAVAAFAGPAARP